MNTEITYCQAAPSIEPCIALFAGGGIWNSFIYDFIDHIYFSSTGVVNSFGTLSEDKGASVGISDGTNGLIIGGHGDLGIPISYASVTIIDTTGTVSFWGDLIEPRFWHSGCSDNTIAVYGGGTNDLYNTYGYDTIEQFSFSSQANATSFGEMDYSFIGSTSASNNIYALFIAGRQDTTQFKGVEYFEFSVGGISSGFGDLNQSRVHHASASDLNSVLSYCGNGWWDGNIIKDIEQLSFDTAHVVSNFGYSESDVDREAGSASDNKSALWAGGTGDIDSSSDILKSVFAYGGIVTEYGNLSVPCVATTGLAGGSAQGCVYYPAVEVAVFGGGYDTLLTESVTNTEKVDFASFTVFTSFGSISGGQGVMACSSGIDILWGGGYGNLNAGYADLDIVEVNSLYNESSAEHWGNLTFYRGAGAMNSNPDVAFYTGGYSDFGRQRSMEKWDWGSGGLATYWADTWTEICEQGSTGNITKGLIIGGNDDNENHFDSIQDFTYAIQANTSGFGTLSSDLSEMSCNSNEVRAVMSCGWYYGFSSEYSQAIEYATGGNTTSWGDITGQWLGGDTHGQGSNGVLGLVGGMWNVVTLDSISLDSDANSTTVGQLRHSRYAGHGAGGNGNIPMIISNNPGEISPLQREYYGDIGVVGAGFMCTQFLERIDIPSQVVGNKFGSLKDQAGSGGGASDGVRGLHFGGGYNSNYDYYPGWASFNIQKYLYSSEGISEDWGEMYIDSSNDDEGLQDPGVGSDGIYALCMGGAGDSGDINLVQRKLFESDANAIKWGYLDDWDSMIKGCSDGTWIFYIGSYAMYRLDAEILYVAHYFGDLIEGGYGIAVSSNDTHALMSGGSGGVDTTEVITMATEGNSTNFGTLSGSRWGCAAVGNQEYHIVCQGEGPNGSYDYLRSTEYYEYSSGGASTLGNDLIQTDHRVTGTSGGGVSPRPTVSCEELAMFATYTHFDARGIDFTTNIPYTPLFEVHEPSSIRMKNVTVQDEIDASIDGCGKVLFETVNIDIRYPLEFTNNTIMNVIGLEIESSSAYFGNNQSVCSFSDSDIQTLDITLNINNNTSDDIVYTVSIERCFVGDLIVNNIND